MRISKNERKQPAEEASPIITPPPNLCSHTYTFDDYDEVVSTDVYPSNLANADTPNHETITRKCSKIKYDDLEELEQQITFGSLNEWEVGTVNVSRKFKD
ncbi:hypothetical protein C1646_778463 [Rhizophagus diaphanus]|nr:hypothetical protein C1646_778463 [Rhizophagus diaphanus] [Rhizophagus sp. MUCL 43196]